MTSAKQRPIRQPLRPKSHLFFWSTYPVGLELLNTKMLSLGGRLREVVGHIGSNFHLISIWSETYPILINVIHTRTQFREKIRYFEKFPSLVLPRNRIITSLSIICSIICQVARSLACSRLPVCGDDRKKRAGDDERDPAEKSGGRASHYLSQTSFVDRHRWTSIPSRGK